MNELMKLKWGGNKLFFALILSDNVSRYILVAQGGDANEKEGSAAR